MFMKQIFSIFFILNTLMSFGQVKIADQKGKPYYDEVVKTCHNSMPTTTVLMNMPNSNIPAGMLDTLKKYDWYELGSYYYFEKTYRNNFAEEGKTNQDQFNFFRIMPDGKMIQFQLFRWKQERFEISTTSFTKETCPTYNFKKIGGFNCIEYEIYNEKSYLTIISYQNGVLVVDTPKTGKAGSKEIKRFRNVYKAVPKGFNWSWN